jgi:hypothetical protein
MTGGMSGNWKAPNKEDASGDTSKGPKSDTEDLDAIKTQLAELQRKLSKLDK